MNIAKKVDLLLKQNQQELTKTTLSPLLESLKDELEYASEKLAKPQDILDKLGSHGVCDALKSIIANLEEYTVPFEQTLEAVRRLLKQSEEYEIEDTVYYSNMVDAYIFTLEWVLRYLTERVNTNYLKSEMKVLLLTQEDFEITYGILKELGAVVKEDTLCIPNTKEHYQPPTEPNSLKPYQWLLKVNINKEVTFEPYEKYTNDLMFVEQFRLLLSDLRIMLGTASTSDSVKGF